MLVPYNSEDMSEVAAIGQELSECIDRIVMHGNSIHLEIQKVTTLTSPSLKTLIASLPPKKVALN